MKDEGSCSYWYVPLGALGTCLLILWPAAWRVQLAFEEVDGGVCPSLHPIAPPQSLCTETQPPFTLVLPHSPLRFPNKYLPKICLLQASPWAQDQQSKLPPLPCPTLDRERGPLCLLTTESQGCEGTGAEAVRSGAWEGLQSMRHF